MTSENHPTPSWFADLLQRLIAFFGRATASISEAAALYVEAVDRDPAFKDWIADQLPQVSGGFWRQLEAVGRGHLDARIASGGCAYGHKLRTLPLSEQRAVLDGTVPLLTASGDTLRIRLDAMLPIQADQVFARDHVRSLSEQKAWMEAEAARAAVEKRAGKATMVPAIEVNRRKRCIVVNGVTLSAADLADYLRKIS
jgi:hypothetical protein